MAESAVASNNAVVKYRTKPEREMPLHKTRKIPKKAKRAHRMGMISDKAMKKHYGDVR